ncbi:DUF2569 family protein [Virgibacillus sp. 179-BFC.A HS]|uniref:DUF2569 family protein n=1 Tax=Tigheibacillus jepli TaxID=3035914 RepID=A0ABU5CF23_9BACI|nr:DUF2569 family protein [Virgibacillus sp. 179-BFC.A HS]MDY0404931.1 DUF2569 family protein [Virgibacillus sp. 179-BFC.A HS]
MAYFSCHSGIFSFTNALHAIITFKPAELEGISLVAYCIYVIYIPLTIIIIFMWGRRKLQLPHWMTVFYLIDIISRLIYVGLYGKIVLQSEIMFMLVSLLWIVYFHRSKRVKATFTY